MWHWHIGDVKRSARRYLGTSYWKTVLVSLVLVIVGALGYSGISAFDMGDGLTFWHNSGFDGGHGKSFGFSWHGWNPGHSFRSGGFHWGRFPGSGGYAFGGMMLAAVLVIILCCVIAAILIGIDIFLLNPIESGCQRFFIVNHVESGRTSLSEMFHSFNGTHYLNVVKTMFLRDLYLFLWSLLFIVPGIIKSYSYRLVPYIIAEQPDMDQREAFRLSREMMDGNKWHAFCLDLSFIGWNILNLFTFGILGIFYVHPYHATANAEMYIAIREQYFHRA